MKRLLLLTLLALAFPVSVHAECPCIPRPVAEKYGNANAVFRGIMTNVEELPGETRMERITFKLQQSWKGTGGPVQNVVFPVSVDACGLLHENIGQSYLVYARAQSSSDLASSTCDGTDLADTLQADIRFLDLVYHPEGEYPLVRFPDVPTDHPYIQAITAFREREFVGGYPDGTFKPEWPISRAELTKIISKVALPYDHDRLEDTYALTSKGLPFTDLGYDAWYNIFVRRAFRAGIIKGYGDGTFRPSQNVTVAEAAAMIVRSLGLETEQLGAVWYERYVRALADLGALPPDIRALTEPITRAQVIEMYWRLSERVTNRESLAADDLLTKKCMMSDDSVVPAVNIRKVRTAWLALYNAEREKRGLAPYTLSAQLNRSAALWSYVSADRGTMTHVRDGTTAYYDYNAIRSWFADLGLTFVNIESQTFTENIGRGPYACSAADCTDTLIAAIRSSFDFYLSEEPREYRPHFNAIVNPSFTMLGLGVAVKNGQYFLTSHFGTRFSVTPPRLCGIDPV